MRIVCYVAVVRPERDIPAAKSNEKARPDAESSGAPYAQPAGPAQYGPAGSDGYSVMPSLALYDIVVGQSRRV